MIGSEIRQHDAPPDPPLRPALPTGWRRAPLGEVCQVNPRRPSGKSVPDDAPTTFVPMAAVDERAGAIAAAEIRPFGEVRKGYTYFEEGDVLFAKITPCMQNGKHAVARGLVGGFGFGTTEFHVLRPGPAVTAEWVHYFLRQPTVLTAATTHFTGAVGQQRVPDSFLATLSLPLPPVQEQRRIAAALTDRLAAVDRLRAVSEARLAAAEALPSACLRAMFEGVEAQAWPRRRVAELCAAIDYGYTASADHSLREPRFLRITDIQDGQVDWTRVPGCKIAESDERRNALADGDIVFARTGGTTGKSFLVQHPPRAVFASYLIRLRPTDGVLPEFLYAFFQSDAYWSQIRGRVRGGAQPNVNATLLGEIVLPTPPTHTQQRIAAYYEERMRYVRDQSRALEEQIRAIGALPAALLREAFTGRL